MKALYIGGFNLPDKNAAAQRVIANAKLLRDIGYMVNLVGLDKEEGKFEYEGFTCQNLKYPSSILEWFKYLFSIKQIVPLIEKCTPSVIVAYNYPAEALELLLRYCQKVSIKLVADCTEWYTPEGGWLFRLIKGWDTWKRMEIVHPKLDGVISISRFLHDYYVSKGTKSIQLPPLVDIEEKKWNNDDHNVKKTGALRLVYAGSPGHKDRLDIIVEAVIEQNDVRPVFFTIIGLNEVQFRQLYNYCETIPDCIFFKGRIPHKEVMIELFASDFQIFVREDNLTTKAGFPTKFVESISAGLPVLTNITSNLDDYLSDTKNGYVLDATTVETLKASLKGAMNKTDEDIKKVKESINRTTFDYRNYISKVKEFLDLI